MENSRTYLITGSASGIGAATATLAEQRGGKVIRCDLRDADIVVDLSTPEGRQALIDQAAGFGTIDAVLAVAGGAHRGIIETNYFGALATLDGLRPLLAGSDAPRAVAVSSTASLAPADDGGRRSLSRRRRTRRGRRRRGTRAGRLAERVRLRQACADPLGPPVAPSPDWGGAGIPLNIVAPGVIDTPAADYITKDPAVRAVIEARSPQPLGFPGRPEWVAELLLWLTSTENHFVTGQIIFCDGGAEVSMVGDADVGEHGPGPLRRPEVRQRSLQRGARFSMNACTPSPQSGLDIAVTAAAAEIRQASASSDRADSRIA